MKEERTRTSASTSEVYIFGGSVPVSPVVCYFYLSDQTSYPERKKRRENKDRMENGSWLPYNWEERNKPPQSLGVSSRYWHKEMRLYIMRFKSHGILSIRESVRRQGKGYKKGGNPNPQQQALGASPSSIFQATRRRQHR